MDIFIENCERLEKRKSRNEVADVTALLDWSNAELEQLSSLTAEYHGNAPYYEPVEVSKLEFSLERSSRVYPESFVKEYSRKESICSTSWATSIVEVAEAAVDNQFEFSVDQLMQCMPAYFDMESGCRGFEPKMIMTYLKEVGLVRKDDFVDCASLNQKAKFTFAHVLPEAPNKSGLMNLVAEGKPVFVMMALDLAKLRFVKDNRAYEPLKSGATQPTMYGIVSGYNANGESPYWEIVSHLLPAEEMIVRVPMSESETNANYAGIAGYAFTLEFMEPPTASFVCDESDYPRIEDIPADATELVFKAGSYPDVESVDFSIFPLLKSLTFEDNSFINCYEVIITGELLTSLEVGDSCFSGNDADTSRRLASLSKSSSCVLKKSTKLQSVKIGNNSFRNVQEVVFDGLKSLKSVQVGQNSFTKHESGYGYDASRSFTVSNCANLNSLSFDRYSFSDFSSFKVTSGNKQR